jgi:hypothetical protein
MGFKKPLELNSVVSQLRKAYGEINSPYNDGFTGWEIKRELYEIKWILDRILKESNSYGEIEQRYLDEVEKQKIIEELKK